MKVTKIVNINQLRDDNFPLEYCARCGTYYKYDYCRCE